MGCEIEDIGEQFESPMTHMSLEEESMSGQSPKFGENEEFTLNAKNWQPI